MLPVEALAEYRRGATISEIALAYGLSESAVGSAIATSIAASRLRKRTQNELRYRAATTRRRLG